MDQGPLSSNLDDVKAAWSFYSIMRTCVKAGTWHWLNVRILLCWSTSCMQRMCNKRKLLENECCFSAVTKFHADDVLKALLVIENTKKFIKYMNLIFRSSKMASSHRDGGRSLPVRSSQHLSALVHRIRLLIVDPQPRKVFRKASHQSQHASKDPGVFGISVFGLSHHYATWRGAIGKKRH